jgi:hypothetical protein
VSDPDAHEVAEQVADDTTDDELEAVAPERVELPPLQAYNVFATFAEPDRARDAVVALERAGIEGNLISALALDRSDATEPGDESTMAATVDKDVELLKELGPDVGRGAAIGAVAGALGSTAVALAIPGVGLALGAGILAVAAGGAMAGTGVGGFAGAVSSTPATPGWEQALIDLDDGRVVIGVHTDDRETYDRAAAVLDDAHSLSVRRLDADGEPI